jgi:hypothetical protein
MKKQASRIGIGRLSADKNQAEVDKTDRLKEITRERTQHGKR